MAMVEELIKEIQTKLHHGTEEQLEGVGQEISLSETDRTKAKARGRPGLLGWINRYISSEELEASEDQGLEKFEELKEVVGRLILDPSQKKMDTPESSYNLNGNQDRPSLLPKHHREYSPGFQDLRPDLANPTKRRPGIHELDTSN